MKFVVLLFTLQLAFVLKQFREKLGIGNIHRFSAIPVEVKITEDVLGRTVASIIGFWYSDDRQYNTVEVLLFFHLLV